MDQREREQCWPMPVLPILGLMRNTGAREIGCRFGPYRPLRALLLVRYYPNVVALSCASSYPPDVPMPLRPRIWQCQYQMQLSHLKQQRAEAQRLFDASINLQLCAMCSASPPLPRQLPPRHPRYPRARQYMREQKSKTNCACFPDTFSYFYAAVQLSSSCCLCCTLGTGPHQAHACR